MGSDLYKLGIRFRECGDKIKGFYLAESEMESPRFSPSSFSDTNDKKKSTPYGVLFFLEMKRSLWEHEDACTNEVAVAYEVCLRHDKERFASYFAKQNAS